MSKIIISAFADEYATELCEQINGMRKLGISNIEIRGVDGENISVISEDKIALVKEALDKNGISVSAVGSPIGKIKIDGDIEAHFEMAERIFNTANILGAKYVRMFSFYRSQQCSAEEYKKSVYSYLERLLTLAEKYGVILCHENEEAIYGESPDACLELLEYFNGRLKAVFDMGNFVLGGYDPVLAYDKLKSYVAYFHIKDAKDGEIVVPGEGNGSIGAILGAHVEGSQEPFFATLEPHLMDFVGLGALNENASEHQSVRFSSNSAAFSCAAEALEKIVNEVIK